MYHFLVKISLNGRNVNHVSYYYIRPNISRINYTVDINNTKELLTMFLMLKKLW